MYTLCAPIRWYVYVYTPHQHTCSTRSADVDAAAFAATFPKYFTRTAEYIFSCFIYLSIFFVCLCFAVNPLLAICLLFQRESDTQTH